MNEKEVGCENYQKTHRHGSKTIAKQALPREDTRQ
jgi:hypothetical protein